MKRAIASALLLAAVALLLSACANQNLSAYREETPQLDLRDYFNGRVMAYGMFQQRDGRVTKRFTVTMDCHWEGDQGVLDERFSYADGTQQRRIWHLTRSADGTYTGRADDVVGQASGAIAGNVFNWKYTLRLPVDDAVYEVQFDDWMYLVDDKVMLNRASMSKFGVRLGDITLSFIKP